jgi:hypothetical protein
MKPIGVVPALAPQQDWQGASPKIVAGAGKKGELMPWWRAEPPFPDIRLLSGG